MSDSADNCRGNEARSSGRLVATKASTVGLEMLAREATKEKTTPSSIKYSLLGSSGDKGGEEGRGGEEGGIKERGGRKDGKGGWEREVKEVVRRMREYRAPRD